MGDTRFQEDTKGYGAEVQNVLLGANGWGVLHGLEVSEKGAGADMSVDVAYGEAYVNGSPVSNASAFNVPITAAHATLDRIDIIVINSSATISVVDGTAASNPLPAAIPSLSIMLARILVQATVSEIYDTDITSETVTVYHVALRDPDGTVQLNSAEAGSNNTEVSVAGNGSFQDSGKTITIDVTSIDFIRCDYELKTSGAGNLVYAKLRYSGNDYSEDTTGISVTTYSWVSGAISDVRALTGSIVFQIWLKSITSITAYNQGCNAHTNDLEGV